MRDDLANWHEAVACERLRAVLNLATVKGRVMWPELDEPFTLVRLLCVGGAA